MHECQWAHGVTACPACSAGTCAQHACKKAKKLNFNVTL